MKEILISVVIPCYEEMGNLQKGVLDHVVHFFEKQKMTYEVLVVDDGSRDGSGEFIEKFSRENSHVVLIRSEHLGKAGAVTKGILAARGEYVLFTDMDQATPIDELDKLFVYFDNGYDVVIGSRRGKRKGAPVVRLFISRANIILRKLLVGLREIEDTQCGFKVFRRGAAQQIFTKLQLLHHGFNRISGSSVASGFDVELLLIAAHMGYKIKEVPVAWLYVETRRVNPVMDSLKGVMALLEIRMNEGKGIY